MNHSVRHLCAASLVMVAGSITGCTSFRTTILQHLPSNYFVDNAPDAKVQGVPVKLKIPSHLEVTITETYYVLTGDAAGDGAVLSTAPGVPQYNVHTNLAYTDKIMTVDFKRPAAGLLNITDTTFDSEQYFKKINAEYEERTLNDINTAITTLKGPLTGAKGAKMSAGPSVGGTAAKTVIPEERTVAFSRFDIREPGWEDRMHSFIDSYLGAGQ